MMDKKNKKQPDEIKNFRLHHYFLKHHYIFPAKQVHKHWGCNQRNYDVKNKMPFADKSLQFNKRWLRDTHFRNTMKQNKSDISDVMQKIK